MASSVQLESRPGGRLRQQLISEVKEYVVAEKKYRAKLKAQKEQFHGVGLDRIKKPAAPYFLVWYAELQRWPGSLLWGGGLLDQPDWIWQMIDLAGLVYNDTQAANEEAIKGMKNAT